MMVSRLPMATLSPIGPGFHPLADLFPLVSGDEFRALVDDIDQHGLMDAIVLHEGLILDGRNRYNACLAAGVEPRFTHYDGDNPLAFVLSSNLHRRHLDESQRAMVAARIATLPHGGAVYRQNDASIDASKTQPAAASALNVSRPSVQRARVVIDHGAPELVTAVDQGTVPVAAAADVARKPASHQRDVVTRIENGLARNVKEAERQIVVERRRRDAEASIAVVGRTAHAFAPDFRCCDVLEGLSQIETASVDLVVADPPYGIGKADWDVFAPDEYLDWCADWISECARILRLSGAMYVFGYPRVLAQLAGVLEGHRLVYRSWIAWDTIMGAGGGLWVNRHEDILYYSRSRETFEDPGAVRLERHEEHVREYRGVEYRFKNPSNIWRFPRVDDSSPERTNHPTQKPLALVERLVLASSPAGGLVVDPFVGSGTSCAAALLHRRRSIGIDSDPDAITMARARCAQAAA